MKAQLASQVRHLLTFLAGIGGILLGWNLIAPEQVAEVNDAGAKLVEPLTVIIGAVAVFLARAALAWFARIFRNGTGELENGSNGGGSAGGPLLLLLLGCTVAGSLLPSCSAADLRTGVNWAVREAAYEVIESTK